MDNSALLHMSPCELALHLRHTSEEQPATTISTHLLEAIELGILPPTVFDVFLTSVRSPCPLRDALWQRYSKHVRHSAIRRFGKALKGVDWEDTWQEVGRTGGLLDLFSQLSVWEVKQLCTVIGRCSRRSAVKNGVERQRRITELVQCLMSPLYPSSPYRNKGQRPLHRHYAKMVSACTSDYVESLLHQHSHPLLESLPKKMLVQHHFELLHRLVLSVISQEGSMEGAAAQRVLDYIPQLLECEPSFPITEPHIPTSISLAVTILERIAIDKEAPFPERFFMPHLIVPLMRRLQTHRVDPSRVQQTIQLAVKYFQGHEHARAQLSLDKRDVVCHVAKYWSRDPSLFSGCLVDLIELLSSGAQRGLMCYRGPIHQYQGLIRQVDEPQRYGLLKIVCLHSTDIRTDIDSDDGLRSTPIQKWPIFIFKMLQRDHSLCLLQKLIRLKPEANFLELGPKRTVLSQARSPGSNFGDTRLLFAILQPQKEVTEHEAQKILVETLKSKASKSREQTDRGFFANSAAFHAIASRSLDLYDEVVQWTRRFLRDAMTVKTIFSPYATLTVEGIALLGGIPEDLGPCDTAEIRTRTRKANSIILRLLDTAVTALREPSFYAPDWHGPLSLFLEVVMTRMSNAGRLENHFQLSEDEVYDLLWAQTTEVLLQAEEIGLQHETLGFNSPHGPLSFSLGTINAPKRASPSVYRFLDNLARSRDALWLRYRPTTNPAVAALQKPWPRGLPIQCLMGDFDVAVDSAFAQTPFMAGRAAEIVMADPVTTLVNVTNEKEMRRAVGQFIDSFEVALVIYVMQCPLGYERDRRVHAAWSHAINVLSDRPSATSLHAIGSTSSASLSETDAKLFWRDIFERALPQVKVPDSDIKINIEYPVIPTESDPQETFEWNPAAKVPLDVERRKLPVTNLDCMIAAPQRLYWKTGQDFHDFHIPKPKTQAIVSTPICSPTRLEHFRRTPRHVQEGMIATALLVVSSKIEGSKLLASPFPSESNVRYPSLFLDHDFLLSSDVLHSPTDIALSRFINVVPPTLILDLTASALDALSRTPFGSTKLASTERTAYMLLILLSKSDRPHLALDLIVHTVLNRPDASSWHRQLLSQSFLRNLRAGQAQDMISLFVSSMLEVLEHQAISSSSQNKAEGSDTSPHRYIKVTTVKFLAQFLTDADFISPVFCVDILSKLLKTTTNVDIRVAVLNSMISRLGRCTDEPSSALAESLMSALEIVIPVLGSLNERRQMQDVDWTEAEKTGKLPEVYDDGGMQAYPPMLNVMLHALKSHVISSNVQRTDFIERILLPTIEKSKDESARWVKMFTLKHLPAGQPIDMPSFPIRPGILVSLIESCSTEIPKYILDLYQQFYLTNILPPASLTKLNDKVNRDIELRMSNEGQYWLSLYGQGAEVSNRAIVSMLTKTWGPSKVSNGIQVSHLQDIVFEQANAVLQISDESFRHWNNLIAALEPPVAQYRSDQDREAWSAYGKPVVLRIINRVDALRTPAWQRDDNRQPAVLPPTFRLRLWVLDYPQLNQSSDDCAIFVHQVVSLLQETIDLGLAHHARLDEISSALSRCLPTYGMDVAHRLGNVDLEDPTKLQENLLRVELAETLLRNVKIPQGKNDETLRSIKAMLDTWQSCEMEDIRMRGVRLSRHLEGSGSKSRWDCSPQ